MSTAKIRFQCRSCKIIAKDYYSALNCCQPLLIFRNNETGLTHESPVLALNNKSLWQIPKLSNGSRLNRIGHIRHIK